MCTPPVSGDTVYMEDENEKKEYVLNDVGKLYFGTEYQICPQTWNFGQVNDATLKMFIFGLQGKISENRH